MGLGQLFTRNLKFDVTDTNSGVRDTFTIVTDGGPGMFPEWQKGEYRGGMGIPAAWRLALLVANQVGRTPWHAFRQVTGRPAEKIEPQPTLLAMPSGTDELALNVWRAAALDRLWHGNAIGVVAARSPLGFPIAATWVRAESVQVQRFGSDPVTGWNNPPPGFAPGEKGYLIGGRWYHAADVIHWKGPSRPGDLRGMGVLENHFQTLHRSQSLDDAASAVTSSAVPTGLLTSLNPDLTKAEAEELKEAWKASQRTRTVAVLNPSTEFTPIAWNPTDTQLLESRQYSVNDWANIFGLPSTYAGGQNSSRVYANIVDQGMDILRYGAVGDLVAEFEALMTSLLPRGQYVKGNLDHLLRADTKGRYEAHAIALASKFMTADEVRELEERAPLTEEQKKAIADAAAPPVPPGGTGPQPARPVAASNSPGSGTSRPRLAAVRALEAWEDVLGHPMPDELRSAYVDELEARYATQLDERGYPEFNQNQPRYPKGNGKYSGRWTDRPGGRVPYGAKSGGTWSKGKWATWEDGTHEFPDYDADVSLSAGKATTAKIAKAALGPASQVAATKPPAKPKTQAELNAEFDAYLDELDVNPTGAKKGSKQSPAAVKKKSVQQEADDAFDAFLGSLDNAPDSAPATGSDDPWQPSISADDIEVGVAGGVDEFDAFMADLGSGDPGEPIKPLDYENWSPAMKNAWDDTPGDFDAKMAAVEEVTPNLNGSWEGTSAMAAFLNAVGAGKTPKAAVAIGNATAAQEKGLTPPDPNAGNATGALPTPGYAKSVNELLGGPEGGAVMPHFKITDAADSVDVAAHLGVTKPPWSKAKDWDADQWKTYWEASMDGMSVSQAVKAANGNGSLYADGDPSAPKPTTTPATDDEFMAAMWATGGGDGGLPGASPNLVGGTPAGPKLDQPPKDLAELEATAAALGVAIPPKGVGSLSWTGDQWKKYWDSSVLGDTPQTAASKANGAAALAGASGPTIGPGGTVTLKQKVYGSPNSRANKIAKQYQQAVGSIPQAEYKAALTYSGSTYTPINEHLWGKTPTQNPAILDNIAQIDALMKKWEAPTEMTVIRGLDDDPNMPSPPATGKTYTAKGYQSTSVGDGAFSGKKVVMKIKVPKGMNGIVMNGGGMSYYPHEEELILPHNTRYVVTKDEMKGGKRWLEVSALPPE